MNSPSSDQTPDPKRAEPRQKRSEKRVKIILDAAATIIDTGGVDAATTTTIAALAGSSVGIIYRYFPNLRSVKEALAARSARRYLSHLESALPEAADNWRASIDIAIDVYVEMMRTEPGFRQVRFGDLTAEQASNPNLVPGTVLASLFGAMLHRKYGFKVTDDLRFALEVSVDVAEALITGAFRSSREGDERFISRTKQLVHQEMDRVPLEG